MFSSRRIGLFDSVPCPDRLSCRRNPCVFSHHPGLPVPPPVPVNAPPPASGPKSILKYKPSLKDPSVSVPAKRPMPSSPPPSESSATRPSPTSEPPRKLQKLGPSKRSVPVPTASRKPSGAPVLDVTPATSAVPVAVRQTCLKSLFDAFVTLYAAFHAEHPDLAHDHALAQEADVYSKTNKRTYRQAIVASIVSLKKRPAPPSPRHDSVGTDAACRARASARSLTVQARHIDAALLKPAQLQTWGYVVEVPDGPGGDRPSEEGNEMQCERCTQRFVVTREGQGRDEACSYHWARPYTTTINGEKVRTYKCCGMAHPGPGCTNGPHVFAEKAAADLHRRHAFSLSSEPAAAEDAMLDVAAMDCEMIYTTGGMRVARVSVVDGAGRAVFDEFVRMDEGVAVVDYITQFSGITAEKLAGAVLDLAAVRRALRALIGPRTVLIGHALDNDLRTLRMVHHRVVDTSVLFPHRAGAPFRRALRDLASDKLNRMIQTGGGTTGHSSVEDAVATLDLVRWWIVHERPRAKETGASASTSAGAGAGTAR